MIHLARDKSNLHHLFLRQEITLCFNLLQKNLLTWITCMNKKEWMTPFTLICLINVCTQVGISNLLSGRKVMRYRVHLKTGITKNYNQDLKKIIQTISLGIKEEKKWFLQWIIALILSKSIYDVVLHRFILFIIKLLFFNSVLNFFFY